MTLQVTVIGDDHAEGEKYDFCLHLGRLLAAIKAVVITGGRTGVMEAVSRGAFEAGGITVGILPGQSRREANDFCRVEIPTGMGHGRNLLNILPADLVIAIGGQAGTLTEMGFAWIHDKPLIAVSKFGGWAGELAGKTIDRRRQGPVMEMNSLEEIRTFLFKFIQEQDG
jgi:uncharacterized protein (TIGR00725 family)